MLQGDTLRKFDKELVTSLATIDWRWPWLEEWEEKFESAGHWPFMWPDFVPGDSEDEDYTAAELAIYRRQAIAPLITHTASALSYHLRDADMIFRVGQRGRLVLLDDPAERWAAAQYPAEFTFSETMVIPPFFPGDRTSVQLVR
jgi:hypothetical protein